MRLRTPLVLAVVAGLALFTACRDGGGPPAPSTSTTADGYDFSAIGHGVLELGPKDLHTLQPGRPDETAPIAVLGAGTGLGEGFLIPVDGGYRGAGIIVRD